MGDVAEFNDDVKHEQTFSEMSLDEIIELPVSRKRKIEKSECPVEKFKKTKGIGDGRYLMTTKANSKDKNAATSHFWPYLVYHHLVGDPIKTRAKVVTRMILGEKVPGVVTTDAQIRFRVAYSKSNGHTG